MTRVAIFSCMLSIAACVRSQPAGYTTNGLPADRFWGTAINGVRCRLYVEDHNPAKDRPIDALTVDVQNVGSNAVSLPLLNVIGQEEVLGLRIDIAEEPDVRSPTGYGGVVPGAHELRPDAIFSFRLSGRYFIAYGKHSPESGWTLFNPEDRDYHLSVRISIGEAEIRSNEVTIRLPKRQTDAKQQDGGYSPPAARSSKPTP